MSRTTLSEHLIAHDCPAALRLLVETVAQTCARIADAIAQGELAGVLGEAGSGNVQGEAQKKLDVIANEMMLQANARVGILRGMASEEMDEVCPLADHDAPYLLLFDPLDGSSNIDVNVSVGTIFSVLAAPADARAATEADFLQPGHAQVAAGYAVYGPATMLVLTTGRGVDGFTLDRHTGVWWLTQPGMRVPEQTKEYAINASNARHWFAPVRAYVDDLLAGRSGPIGKDYNMRWVASMVADVHRIMSRGGIFMYPRDARDPDKPGKLRLMYEANPMSLLVEQAGGAAHDGAQRILDIEPTGIHQRVAVFLGSREEVERARGYD